MDASEEEVEPPTRGTRWPPRLVTTRRVVRSFPKPIVKPVVPVPQLEPFEFPIPPRKQSSQVLEQIVVDAVEANPAAADPAAPAARRGRVSNQYNETMSKVDSLLKKLEEDAKKNAQDHQEFWKKLGRGTYVSPSRELSRLQKHSKKNRQKEDELGRQRNAAGQRDDGEDKGLELGNAERIPPMLVPIEPGQPKLGSDGPGILETHQGPIRLADLGFVAREEPGPGNSVVWQSASFPRNRELSGAQIARQYFPRRLIYQEPEVITIE